MSRGELLRGVIVGLTLMLVSFVYAMFSVYDGTVDLKDSLITVCGGFIGFAVFAYTLVAYLRWRIRHSRRCTTVDGEPEPDEGKPVRKPAKKQRNGRNHRRRKRIKRRNHRR